MSNYFNSPDGLVANLRILFSKFRTSRTWDMSLMQASDNLAEHIVRVQMIAFHIAYTEGYRSLAKLGAVSVESLLHVPSELKDRAFHVDETQSIFTRRNENASYYDMYHSKMGTSLVSHTPVWHERSIFTQIVREADTLDYDFELTELLAENTGMIKLEDFYEVRKSVRDKMLHTDSAKAIWYAIYQDLV